MREWGAMETRTDIYGVFQRLPGFLSTVLCHPRPCLVIMRSLRRGYATPDSRPCAYAPVLSQLDYLPIRSFRNMGFAENLRRPMEKVTGSIFSLTTLPLGNWECILRGIPCEHWSR